MCCSVSRLDRNFLCLIHPSSLDSNLLPYIFAHIYTKHDETTTGRGKPFQEHEGNIKLSKLIESRHAEYAKANRAGKTSISWEIVRLIQRDGGSFLKKDECSGAWKKETDEIAREKVSHGFRTKNK